MNKNDIKPQRQEKMKEGYTTKEISPKSGETGNRGASGNYFSRARQVNPRTCIKGSA